VTNRKDSLSKVEYVPAKRGQFRGGPAISNHLWKEPEVVKKKQASMHNKFLNKIKAIRVGRKEKNKGAWCQASLGVRHGKCLKVIGKFDWKGNVVEKRGRVFQGEREFS